MRVLVTTCAISIAIAAVARAEPVADGTRPTADRIERARVQALDADDQPQLPRYDHADEADIRCLTDPDCVRSRGGGGAFGSDGGSGARNDGTGTARRPRRLGNGELADGDFDRRRMVDTREQANTESTSSLMTFVLWAMLIVIGVLAAVWLVGELRKDGGDAVMATDESQTRMQAAIDAIIERPLGDADELAQRGAYAEAIHTLLLRTLQELVRSAAVRVAPAMTSREILARVPLLADTRDALSGLITAVEVTHFGDEPANAADYDRCRAQFHLFATAFRVRGAA